MPDNRRSLQVNQPNVINLPDNNWPEPLTDASNPLKMVVTSGGNGTQKNFDPVSTSNQKELSLAEGKSSVGTGDMSNQGGHSDKLKTSQQNAGDHHTPEA